MRCHQRDGQLRVEWSHRDPLVWITRDAIIDKSVAQHAAPIKEDDGAMQRNMTEMLASHERGHQAGSEPCGAETLRNHHAPRLDWSLTNRVEHARESVYRRVVVEPPGQRISRGLHIISVTRTDSTVSTVEVPHTQLARDSANSPHPLHSNHQSRGMQERHQPTHRQTESRNFVGAFAAS